MNSKLSYTYCIGWKSLNKYYYGVRTANKHEPENDLWVHYFTSSKHVTKFRELHGEPDLIHVNKIFESESEARDHEIMILKKIDVISNDMWLNKHILSYSATKETIINGQTFSSRKEAAEYFGVCYSTISNWLNKGKIPIRGEHNKKEILIDGILYPSIKEASEFLKVSVDTVSRWVKNGKRKKGEKNKKPLMINGILYPSRIEAAKEYGVNPDTISRYVKSGKSCLDDLKNFKKENNGMFGKTHTPDTKKKMTESKKKKKLLKGERYQSINDAMKKLNITRGTAQKWIDEKRIVI